jgi:sulfur carrier protein ThiS
MITLILRKEKFEFPNSLTVKEALLPLGLTTETHLAVRAGVLLHEDDLLEDGDVVQLIATIAGGSPICR